MDVGAIGQRVDGGVWERCLLSRAIENNWIDFPSNAVLVGDDAFPLKSYLMKPYQKRNLKDKYRICNYRFSRARRVLENTFGSLVSRFKVLKKPIALKNLKTVMMLF
jgi:hypothetical protein